MTPSPPSSSGPGSATGGERAVVTLRDLPNGATLLDGVITAGQPSAAQLDTLARAGVRTMVDLRAATEPRGFDEAVVVEAARMTYHRIPVTQQTLDASAFDALRAVLRDRGDHPVLVHCATAHRVGALLIPYLVLDAARAPDEALGIAAAVGLRSDDLARAAFDYVRDARR